MSSVANVVASITIYFNGCIGALILVMNIFVISLFIRRPSLRSSISNKILLSLAIRDVINGILIFIVIIISKVEVLYRASTTNALIFRIIIDLISTGNNLTAVAHLTLIAYDRFVAIFQALRYGDVLTNRIIRLVLIAIWCCSYCIAFLQLIWLHRVMVEEATTADWLHVGGIEPWYSTVVLGLFIIAPLVVVLLAYLRMFAEIRRIVNYNGHDNTRNTRQQQQRRVFFIFLAMHICFMCLTLPIFITRLLMDISTITKERHSVTKEFLEIAYLISNIASFSTPLLYTFYKQDFRQCLTTTIIDIKLYMGERSSYIRSKYHDDFLQFSHTSEFSVSRDTRFTSNTTLNNQDAASKNNGQVTANTAVELKNVKSVEQD